MRAHIVRPLTGRQQLAMAMKLSIASASSATHAALTTSTVQIPPSALSPKRERAAVAAATRNSVAGGGGGGEGVRDVGDNPACAVGGESGGAAAGAAPAPEDATPLAPPQLILTASRGTDAHVAAAGAGGEEAGAATEAAQSSSSPAPEDEHDALNMVIGTMAVGGGTSGSVERTVTVLRRPTGAWFYKRPNGKRSFIRTEHRVRVELAEGITSEMLRHTSPTNAPSSKALKHAPSPRSSSGEKRRRSFSSSGRGRGSKASSGGGPLP